MRLGYWIINGAISIAVGIIGYLLNLIEFGFLGITCFLFWILLNQLDLASDKKEMAK